MPFTLLSQGSSANFLKDIRLIASDMDGTLTQNGKFTPILLQTLTDLAAAGITVLVVTGRSAGWVNALVSYLPIAGSIAENGGLYYTPNQVQPLVPLSNFSEHRQNLAHLFQTLQQKFPHLQASIDNPFRLTDWTFDVQGLSQNDLQWLNDRCQTLGWGFTYSTVQCHLMLPQQNKAAGLLQVLAEHFPDIAPDQVVTIGDSPNDESLFDPTRFPHSIGVANLRHYADQLAHQPTYITDAPEVAGFCQVARYCSATLARYCSATLTRSILGERLG